MKKPILIFPAGMPRALEYLERALSEGSHVVGASSLAHDPSRENYPAWLYLPYITAPGFNDALKQALIELNIGAIYTANPVVWNYLNRELEKLGLGISLINRSPINAELTIYRSARKFAQSVNDQPVAIASVHKSKVAVSTLEIASLFRHAELIPGMCDHEKIRALCEIARHCPPGDIVEIGSWWGKSAFVLARLASCYEIGNLLCIDPWSDEHLIQHDEKGLVDSVPLSADEAFGVFQMNLLPYANHNVNYLKLPSTEAAERFRNDPVVKTTEFGITTYSGHVAILHVDGNHQYSNAKADIACWGGLVAPGGWIIVDDYIWPYGDGPQRQAMNL